MYNNDNFKKYTIHKTMDGENHRTCIVVCNNAFPELMMNGWHGWNSFAHHFYGNTLLVVGEARLSFLALPIISQYSTDSFNPWSSLNLFSPKTLLNAISSTCIKFWKKKTFGKHVTIGSCSTLVWEDVEKISEISTM